MGSNRLQSRAAAIVVAVALAPLASVGPALAPGPATVSAAFAADAATDSANFDMKGALAALRQKIAGRENAPSDSVWKNIKVLKQLPAGRLLSVMEMGFSRSLGVNCLHCHVAGEWESDKKRPKQVARDMSLMSARINNELLKAIPNLQSEKPTVNCTTCHRGELKPALDLGAAPAPAAKPPAPPKGG
jgi:hypothetical protein